MDSKKLKAVATWMGNQSPSWTFEGRTLAPDTFTRARRDRVPTDARLYFRQHGRLESRWQAGTEIPQHLCPREDLRLQFGKGGGGSGLK